MANTQSAIWQCIYNKYFPELKVVVPAFTDVEGKTGIYVAEDLGHDRIFDALNFESFKCAYSIIDREIDILWEARNNIGSYLVRVESSLEPDAKFIGKSVETINELGVLGITLKERMLFELFFFEITGKNLDVRGLTFCSGSRYQDGGVPTVGQYGKNRTDIGWCHVSYDHGYEGVREVVLELL